VGGGATKDVEWIVRELHAAADERRAIAEKKYLKSDLDFLGVSMPAMRSVVKRFLAQRPATSRVELTALARALWSAPVFERRAVAVELLIARDDLLTTHDMRLAERLIRGSKTWALVDPLAVAVAGGLVSRFPVEAATLDRWARDEDFWVRRAAILALLGPLRRGEGDFARFARYADGMLEETEFFIRKAIGWVLRETSKKRPDLVYDWLAPRAGRASGVTVREAVKYLSARQRDEVTRAYRSRVSRSGRPSGSRRRAR
jgi:3-methyladenine DNA glycosylase AlkD